MALVVTSTTDLTWSFMDQNPSGSQRQPTRTIAQRVRVVRKRRDWSAEDLAAAMRSVGIPWERGVVAKLEAGRREQVTVDEVLALAWCLDVAVVDLITDPAGSPDLPYQLAPEVPAHPVSDVRAWISGGYALPGVDERRYLLERPVTEWRLGQFGAVNATWSAEREAQAEAQRDG